MTPRDVLLVALAVAGASACRMPVSRTYRGRVRPESSVGIVEHLKGLGIDSVDGRHQPCVMCSRYAFLPGPHTLRVSFAEMVSVSGNRATILQSAGLMPVHFLAEAGHRYLMHWGRTASQVVIMLFDLTSGTCVSPDTSWTRQDPPQCYPPSVQAP
jgi:hypothetical protein